MATQAQIDANRLNALHSTGPRTAEGKEKSSANARKEGFTATRLVVEEKHKAEFEAYYAALVADTHPEGAIEVDIFNRLLNFGWNSRRIILKETQTLEIGEFNLSDPAVEHRIALYARYRRDLDRAYYRALKELEHRQTERAVLLQQECEAISKASQIAPMATLTKITKITDPFFRITRCVAQTTDLEVSREAGHQEYQTRHNKYLAGKAAEAAEKRDEPKAPVVLPLNQEELAMYSEPNYLAALK
jgi:hypothetical protein